MSVVSCPHCTNPVTLPPTWGGAAYTCPHCRRVAGGSPPPPPRPVTPQPIPVPVPPPSFTNETGRDPDPPRRYRQPSGSSVGDFFTFRLMITPVLIQIVFWLGVAGCVLRGGMLMVESFEVPRSSSDRDDERPEKTEKGDKQKAKAPATQFSPLLFAGGVAIMTLGPLVIRLYCELMIIIFKIHDELKAANDRRGRA